MQRIGVFVCWCGSNIAATVDVQKVAETLAKEPGVVHSMNYQYMCSQAGQELIKEAIKEHKLTGIVVCSCSPRMHEATFRKTASAAGLNPYMVEIANIREQCSWIHKDMEEATEKKAIRKIAKESGKLAYYINAATQSAVVDRFRSDSGATVVTYPPEVLDVIIESRIAAQRLPFEDSYWDVQLLKRKLPPREWLLLEAKYLIGYSDEEVGRIYGCAKDSVRMALTRAKRKAREILFNNDAEGGESNEQ